MDAIEQWTIGPLPPASLRDQGGPRMVQPGSKLRDLGSRAPVGPTRLRHPWMACSEQGSRRNAGLSSTSSQEHCLWFTRRVGSSLRPLWTAYGPGSATGLLRSWRRTGEIITTRRGCGHRPARRNNRF